jgi:hypothetical protein
MELGDTAITDVLPGEDSLSRYSALDLTPRAEDYVDSYVLLAARGESRTVTGAIFDISSVGTPRRPEL